MTAIPAIAYSNMDLLHADDTMDLASSPHMGEADDIDIDLEDTEDAYVEPHSEPMIEDLTNAASPTKDIQVREQEILDDDDMLDEETVIHHSEDRVEDMPMDAPREVSTTAQHEDDDILYDEDDDETSHVEPVFSERAQHFHNDSEDAWPDEEIEEGQRHEIDEAGSMPQELHEDIYAAEINTNEPTETNEIAETAVDARPTEYAIDTNADASAEQLPPGTTNERPGIAQPTSTVNDEDTTVALPQEEKPDVAERNVLEETSASNENAAVPASMNGDSHDSINNLAPLHTVKVNYQDTEMCLFPPRQEDDSEMFFLSDVSLAYASLDKMLRACREVLAGSIGDDDEFVLDVASLGLHISEGSSYATQMSLSQILEVYLVLAHNEEVEYVEPLYCNLTSRVCLASQYAYLHTAANQGRTFTEIAAEHLESLDGSEDESAAEADANATTTADVNDETAEKLEVVPELINAMATFDEVSIQDGQLAQPRDEVAAPEEEQYNHEEPEAHQKSQDEEESAPTLQKVEDPPSYPVDSDGEQQDTEKERSIEKNDAHVAAGTEHMATPATSTVQGDESIPETFPEDDATESLATANGVLGGSGLQDRTGQVPNSTKIPAGEADTESSYTIQSDQETYDAALAADVSDADSQTAEDPNQASGLDEFDVDDEGENEAKKTLNSTDVEAEPEDMFDEKPSHNAAEGHSPPAEISKQVPVNGTHPDTNETLLNPEDVALPSTPPADKSSKRKVREEEDDEIDLLEDFDTPDKKRSRPS